MFSDPLVLRSVSATAVTAAAIAGAGSAALSLVRTGTGVNNATYRGVLSPTHSIDVFIGRQTGKRTRYTVRITESEIVADPLTGANSVNTSTIYFVADIGILGTGTNWDQIATALGWFLIKPSDSTATLASLLIGNV